MRSYLRYTFALAWRQKKRLLVSLGLLCASTITRLGQPYLYKLIVDTLTAGILAGVFAAHELQFLMGLVALWFVLTMLNTISAAQSTYLGWAIGNISAQHVHIEGYRRLLRLDYHEHKRRHSSYLAKLVDNADTAMWEMSTWWFNRFIPAFLGFAAMLVIAFSVSWQMTLVSLSIIPVGLWIVVRIIARSEARQRLVNKLWDQKHEHLSDQLVNIATYKLNQDEARFVAVQRAYSDRAMTEQLALNKQWRLAEMLNPDVLARFLVMGFGVYLVTRGGITLGTLFMFMGLMNEILTPLHLLGDILPQYSRRARHLEKFLDLMNRKDKIVDAPCASRMKRAHGKIEFKDVSFEYGDEAEKGFSLNGISFVVESGEHVALVGHSGSGKSTLMMLVSRLMDPTRGQILLDGIDVRKIRQEDFRRQIGTVLQESSLYNETIADNIAYGNPSATRAQIVSAAKKAAAHIFIAKLAKGYDTMIGERGVRLSGGEKQRVAIARSILKNPSIVVLDEPTSALDSITEQKVEEGLKSLLKGRTAIIIAHRLATVRHADKIVVMENGQIVDMGPHESLMKTCPVYQEMVRLQTGGFLAEED